MSARLLPRVGARDARALLLGAIITVPVLAHQVAVKPYLAALRETRDVVAQERALLERELTLLWYLPRTAEDIRTVGAAAYATHHRLFAGNDPIEATSALSAYAGGVARDADLAVQQVDSRDATELATGLREIVIDIRAEGTLEEVLRALRGLEAGPRLVRVTRVSVERAGTLIPGSEPLRVTATVRGYARISE